MDDPYSLSDDQDPKRPLPPKVTVVHGSKPGRQPPSSARSLWRWSIFSSVALIVFVLLQQIPSEIARWYRAAAIEQWTQGHKEQARETLNDSLRWQPGSLYVPRVLAVWEKEEKNYVKALEYLDTCLESIPKDTSLLMERAELLQLLDRPAEAIAIFKAINAQSIASGLPAREIALNALAYSQAVGNLELPEALTNINSALEILETFPATEKDQTAAATSKLMCLDTRGFILYRLGKFDEALKDMDAAVAGLNADPISSTLIASSKDADESKDAKAPRLKAPKTPDVATVKKGIAVIFYHRALVLKELHQEDKANDDLKIVKRLYGEPDKTLF